MMLSVHITKSFRRYLFVRLCGDATRPRDNYQELEQIVAEVEAMGVSRNILIKYA